MVGNTADVTEVHTTIVQPYIDHLCKNIEKRFGDSTSHVSIAVSLFHPQKFDKLDLKAATSAYSNPCFCLLTRR